MNNLIETYPGHLWSRIFDNALTDNGSIVDVGCLNWDWDIWIYLVDMLTNYPA